MTDSVADNFKSIDASASKNLKFGIFLILKPQFMNE